MDEIPHEVELFTSGLSRNMVAELCSGRRFADYRQKKIELLKLGAHRAIFRQDEIGKINQQVEKKHVDGLGAHRATIDPLIYHAIEKKYGQGCWRDPAFLNDMLKKNPSMRVHPALKKSWMVNGRKNANRSV